MSSAPGGNRASEAAEALAGAVAGAGTQDTELYTTGQQDGSAVTETWGQQRGRGTPGEVSPRAQQRHPQPGQGLERPGMACSRAKASLHLWFWKEKMSPRGWNTTLGSMWSTFPLQKGGGLRGNRALRAPESLT